MRMQRERRRDPYPWTWEIPLAIGIGVLLLVTAGIQLGRSLANLVAGAGWTWPASDTGQRHRCAFPSPLGQRVLEQPARCPRRARRRGPVPGPTRERSRCASGAVGLPGRDRAAAPGRVRVGRRPGLPAVGTRPDEGHGHRRGGRDPARHHPAAQGRQIRPPRSARPPRRNAVRSAVRSVGRTAAGHDADTNIAVRHGMSPWLLPGRRSSSRETQR